jgi:Zn finger protein HypA/HybF involved in hydrogenase expression
MRMMKDIPRKVIKKETYYSIGYSPVINRCPNCEEVVNRVIHQSECGCGQKSVWD